MAEEGYSVGTVFLQVVPSFKNVQNEARKHADQYADEFGKEVDKKDLVGKGLDDKKGSAKKAGQKAGEDFNDYFERLVRGRISKVLSDLPKIKVDADTSAADRDIAALRQRLQTIKGAKISMDIDAASVVAEIDRVQRDLERLSRSDPRLEVRADAAEAIASLESVLKVAARVDGQKTRIEVDVDKANAAAAQLLALERRIDKLKLAGHHVEINIDTDGVAAAEAKLAALEAETRAAGGGANDGGASFRAFNGILLAVSTVGSALIPIIAALAGGALALGPAFIAAAAGGGVLYLAFSGISKAVTALNAQHKMAGQDALTSAKSQRSAANGIASAEDAVSQARLSAARAAEDAAKRIVAAERSVAEARRAAADQAAQSARAEAEAARTVADAVQSLADARQAAADQAEQDDRSVADARDNLARTIESANRAVVSSEKDLQRAEENLVQAQKNVLKAQQALNDARTQAVQDQQDLNYAVRQGIIDEAEARNHLEDAASKLAQAQAGGDPETIQRAQIAYDQATLSLEEQITANQRLADEKAASDAAGIEGSKGVLSAQQALTDAINAQADAQQAVADARTALDAAQLQSTKDIAAAQRDLNDAIRQQARDAQASAAATKRAERDLYDARLQQSRVLIQARRDEADAQQKIADAESALADAREQAARSAADSMHSIAQAQQSLATAQASAADAASATTASARNVQDAFDQLGPAGQEFATFIADTLMPALAGLRGIAEAGVLPGVEDLFKSLLPYAEPLKEFIGTMAKVFGDMFRAIGEGLKSKTWQDFFSTMAKFVPIFTQQFATVIGNVATGMAGLMTALAPLTEAMGNGLIKLSEGFKNFGAGAKDSESFQGFIRYVEHIAPKVEKFFGALVGAFVAIGKALAPLGEGILTGLTAVLGGIAKMNPTVLQALSIAILSIIAAAQISFGITALATAFTELGLGAAFAALSTDGLVAAFTALETGTIIGLIVVAIIGLVVALVQLYKHSEIFRDIVNAAWDAVKKGFELMAAGLKYAYDNVLHPLLDALGAAVSYVWEKVVKPVFKAFGDTWAALVKGMRFVYDNVLKPLFDVVGYLISFWWNHEVRPIFAAFQLGWSIAVFGIQTIWNTILHPVFSAVGSLISTVWSKYISPTFDAMKIGWSLLAQHFRTAYNNYLAPVFDALSDVFTKYIAPAFSAGINAIQSAWDKLTNIVKAPVRFVVDTVINGALIGSFNKLADFFGTTKIKPFNLPAAFDAPEKKAAGATVVSGRAPAATDTRLAMGGVVPGSSPHPKADNIPAWLTAGEFVQPVATVDYYGPAFMEAIRQRRIPKGLLGFADGGLIPSYGLGGKIAGAVAHPTSAIMDAIKKLLDKIPGGDFGKLLGEAPLKLAQEAMDFLGGLAKSVVGSVAGAFSDGPLVGALGGNPGKNRSLGKLMAASRGWGDGAEWSAMDKQIQFESGWNNTAQNPTSTAYGIAQFLNGTWAGVGLKKTSDPATQIEGYLRYVAGRYGDPINSWKFEQANRYYGEGGPVKLYDTGGVVPPGRSSILNLTGGNEYAAVLTPQQLATVQSPGVGSGGPMEIVGTLDLGDGIVGVVRGVIREDERASTQNRRAGG